MRARPAKRWLGLAILAASTTAWAQGTVALTVVVLDPGNAPISHAYVEATSIPAGIDVREQSDASGKAILHLVPGGYSVRAGAWPFRWKERLFDVRGAYTIPVNLAIDDQAGYGSQFTATVPPDGSGSPQDQPAAPAVHAADVLTITALGEHATYTLDTLKSLPHQTVTIFDHHTNANETYSGVALIDLLAKLGVPHGAAMKSKALADYVIATGSDGYKSVIALGEIDPEFHPGVVLLADAMNGKPLGAAGPFRLIVGEDKRPARSVRNLASIEVRTAE